MKTITSGRDSRVQPKVAFIGHPTDINLFRNYVKFLRPDKVYNDQLVMKLFEWAPSYPMKHWDDLQVSPEKVEGLFIMVPFLPEMKDIRLKQVIAKIEGALEIASQNKCTVAALGAFTSIVLQGKEKELSEKYNVKLTSGNSFTAALIVDGILNIVNKFNLNLQNLTMAIVGASGDIGSGCVAYFANKVKKMYLTARSTPTLESVKKRWEDTITCETIITDNSDQAIQNSEIIIFVTSAYTTLYELKDFKPGTIVCDASAPSNVAINDEKLRDDVFLFHGGIVQLPHYLDNDFSIGLAAPDHFYGCQTEGILIALDETLPCSWGRGNITPEILDMYLNALQKNSLLKVAFSAGEKVYSEKDINTYMIKWQENFPYQLK
jgi:fatty aldehyde-generating acyl-ACP reductase